LVGKSKFMRLGGLLHDEERVFLLSTTHGAETHALAAAIATMRVYQSEPVIETLFRQGSRLAEGIDAAIRRHDVVGHVALHGKPCCLVFSNRDQDRKQSQSFRTLFLQELMKRGVLGPSLIVSYSHTDEDVDRTIEAFDDALAVYRKALDDGVDDLLVGQPSQIVYRRYNNWHLDSVPETAEAAP